MKVNLIIKYFSKYCNSSRKIYIFGLYSSNVENLQNIIDERIIKVKFESANIHKYNYKEMNIEDNQSISNFLLEIFAEVEKVINIKKKNNEEKKENCLIY